MGIDGVDQGKNSRFLVAGVWRVKNSRAAATTWRVFLWVALVVDSSSITAGSGCQRRCGNHTRWGGVYGGECIGECIGSIEQHT